MVRQTHEALDHANEIARAGRDFNQAMERWKVIRDEEQGSALSKQDTLLAPGGVIDSFEGLSDQVDDHIRKSLKRGYDKAKRQLEQVQQRLAILTPKTGPDRKQAQIELTQWLEQDYVGGAKAAFRDLRLRQASPWLASFLERAKERRQIVVQRQQALVEEYERIQRTQPGPEAHAMQERVKSRAQKIDSLEDALDRIHGEKHKKTFGALQRKVALGIDLDTAFENIDWGESRFPDREDGKELYEEVLKLKSGEQLNPRKLPGMLKTQPDIPTPKPPNQKGQDQEIPF